MLIVGRWKLLCCDAKTIAYGESRRVVARSRSGIGTSVLLLLGTRMLRAWDGTRMSCDVTWLSKRGWR